MSFLCSGLSLFCLINKSKRLQKTGKVIAAFIFIIGIVRFTESFTSYTSGIDRWIYSSKLVLYGNNGKPNFMAPNTALLFALTGASLFLYQYRLSKKNLITDFLAFAVTALSFLCIIGYIYNSTELYHVKSSIPMAFPTALSFFLVSTGILLQRSAFGFFSLFTRKYIGSKVARFLTPFAIIVPVAAGLLQLRGENVGLFSAGLGEAIFDTANVMIFLLLIWRCCAYLNKENKAHKLEMAKRLHAEETARLNEEFLNTLIENLPEMVFVKDEKLRFIRVNKAAEKAIGAQRKDLIGKTDYDFFSKEQADQFTQKDHDVFKSGEIVVIPEESIGFDENMRWLCTKKIVVKGPDGRQFLLGISQDITERKKMNEQLREFNRQLEKKVFEGTNQLIEKENEKILLERSLMEEKINRQKQLMQATIDGQEKEKKQIGMELHDNINQILASTRLYLDLATNESVKDEMILKSKEQISIAINEIRSLSKSLVPYGVEKKGVFQAINEIIDTIELSAEIKFESNLSQDVLDKLDMKVQMSLYRIIQEQLNNVLKHAKARKIGITLTEQDGMVTLWIEDDGKGFDMTKKRAGIGLSNIQSRVELLEGEMEIESAEGRGCKLQIRFNNHKLAA